MTCFRTASLRNIVFSFQKMPRLLIGIGRPADKADVGDYVLDEFTADQASLVDSIMSDALRTMMAHISKNCAEIIRTRIEDNSATEEG